MAYPCESVQNKTIPIELVTRTTINQLPYIQLIQYSLKICILMSHVQKTNLIILKIPMI